MRCLSPRADREEAPVAAVVHAGQEVVDVRRLPGGGGGSVGLGGGSEATGKIGGTVAANQGMHAGACGRWARSKTPNPPENFMLVQASRKQVARVSLGKKPASRAGVWHHLPHPSVDRILRQPDPHLFPPPVGHDRQDFGVLHDLLLEVRPRERRQADEHGIENERRPHPPRGGGGDTIRKDVGIDTNGT